MRIAWLLYGTLDQKTGGTIYDRIVVEGLRAAGDQVRVVSLAPPPSSTALAIPAGALAGVRVGRMLRRMRPDVVVGDELCFREIAAAFPLLRRTRALRVLLVHHLTSWETERSKAERWLARRAEHLAIDVSDRIVTTSAASRERLVAELAHAWRGGVPEIDVAVPGADRLPRLPRPPRTTSGDGVAPARLLFLGAIVARKRVLELVRAFARGASPSATLTLLGSATRDPAYASRVARAIDTLGVAHRVRMDGEVAEEGVARSLSEADALVMPSSLEGWGIAATEAIHAGVPVIAARASGLEEALRPAGGAARFADTDEDLAAALHAFTTDPVTRATMTEAAAIAAARMPAWSTTVATFRAAIAPRRHAPPSVGG